MPGHHNANAARRNPPRGPRAEGVLAWPPRETDLTSHMNIMRPLCTLSGPTNRAEPGSKMVTECAKCVPAPRDAPALAAFARFVAPSGNGDQPAMLLRALAGSVVVWLADGVEIVTGWLTLVTAMVTVSVNALASSVTVSFLTWCWLSTQTWN